MKTSTKIAVFALCVLVFALAIGFAVINHRQLTAGYLSFAGLLAILPAIGWALGLQIRRLASQEKR